VVDPYQILLLGDGSCDREEVPFVEVNHTLKEDHIGTSLHYQTNAEVVFEDGTDLEVHTPYTLVARAADENYEEAHTASGTIVDIHAVAHAIIVILEDSAAFSWLEVWMALALGLQLFY
jgi:hypothetical protein